MDKYYYQDQVIVNHESCRACMRVDDGCVDLSKVIDIKDTESQQTLAYIFNKCTALEVSTEDGLPKNVCQSCAKKLQTSYEFRLQCEKNDLIMRNIIANSTSSLEDDNIILVHIDDSDEEIEHAVDAAKPFKILPINENNTVLKTTYQSENKQNFKINSKLKNNLLEKPKFDCKTCHKAFVLKSALSEHLKVHNVFECLQCSETFQNENNLLNHMNMAHKNDASAFNSKLKGHKTCLQCNDIFRSHDEYITHMRTVVHDNIADVFCCKICMETFTRKLDFHTHFVQHPIKERIILDKPYLCIYCNKSLKFLNGLITHIQTHRDSKSYLCSECGKHFGTLGNLKMHIISHSTATPFACHVCPKKFKSNASLKLHVNTHTGTRPWVCDICDKSFNHPKTLRLHKTIHSGIKKFKCDTCDKRFIARDHLKRHSLTHTGEKPFACQYCDKKYNQMYCLTVHLRSHVGEHMYECTGCGEKFCRKNELNKHYRSCCKTNREDAAVSDK